MEEDDRAEIDKFFEQFWEQLQNAMLHNGRCVDEGGPEWIVLQEFIKNIKANGLDIKTA